MKITIEEIKPAIGYCGATFTLGMMIASLGPTLPSLAELTNSSLSSTGALFSMRSLGYLLGSLFFGRAYDRFRGNRILAVILIISAILITLVPLSSILILTAFLLLIIGLSLGGIDVGSNTLTVWHYQQKASPYLNALYLFAGFGGLLIPLLTGQILFLTDRVHAAYWILALLILPAAFWVFNQPSPNPLVSHENEDKKEHDLLLIAFFGILFFLFVGTEVSFGGWIYTYTLIQKLGQISTASLMNANFWLALTIGRLLAIPISARIQPEKILQVNIITAIISLGIIILLPSSLIGVSIGTFIFGIALASNFPMTFSIAKKYLNITGKLTGILWALGSLGAIITPWLIGGLIESFSPLALITTLFIYMWIGFVILVVFNLLVRTNNR